MISSKLEFSFIKQCFEHPELWAFGFYPSDPIAELVQNEVKEYKTEYGTYPTLETFYEYLSPKLGKQQFSFIIDSLNVELDKGFVLDKVVKFLEKKKLEGGIREAQGLIEKDKIQEAKLALLQGTELVYSKTLDYFRDERATSEFDYVSTGFKCFDAPMGGGLHTQNLGLFIGPKSSGKSLTMINIGANAVNAGKRVLHVSFEDSEDQIASRYDKKFPDKSKMKDRDLFVHIFPSGGATIADCEALVNVYKPHLVIIDYLNEVGVDKRNNRSEELGDIARMMRGTSKRHNCSVWTAQQAGRGAKFSKEDVAAEDAFWSYEPSQVADIVITLNQTKDEKEAKEIRYVIDRHRNGPDGLSFPFKIDYAGMNLTPLDRFVI